jgi:ABC-type nitrate/sulfonate/bicarbonate transport system substrate-binding protein
MFAPQTNDLRYGGQYYPGEWLLYGHPEFWSNYDLAVDHVLFSSGAENNEALISGGIDINCGADSKTVELFNAIPDDALIIGTVQRGNRYTTIVRADSDIGSWDDLLSTKAKKVCTRFGTGAEGVLRRFFNQTVSPELGRNYEWEDFEWVNLNIEEMISALEAGHIDAFTGWEPTPAIAEAQGVGKSLMTYGNIAMVPASIHTTKSFAYNHPALVVAFLAAHLDKAELIKNDPAQAAQIASQAAAKKGVEVSAEAFEKVFERIDFRIDFNETVIDEIYVTANFLTEQGKINTVPELAWNASFLEAAEALHRLG